MPRPRIIPCLTIVRHRLVKTKRFAAPRYLGDPLNALRVFSDKEVDELVLLDIESPAEGPDLGYLAELACEAFMPVGYGGGIKTVAQAEAVLGLGFEKVVLGPGTMRRPELIDALATSAGSQSVIVCLDVRGDAVSGYRVVAHRGRDVVAGDPVQAARVAVDAGAGELILQHADLDGTRAGYDLDLIARVAAAVSVPVIALGGAGSTVHLRQAIAAGAGAAAAGSLFTQHGRRQAVLLTYPAGEIEAWPT